MGLTAGRAAAPEPGPPAERSREEAVPERVVWHDLECGGYRADLSLWAGLAAEAGGPLLEIGAGTGRVALELYARGHDVTAVDIDSDLLEALSERAGAMRSRPAGARVEAVRVDARALALQRRDFALCIVAMQTIQLFGGAEERIRFLRRARAHLRPGGIVACAIATELEPFDCAAGDPGPARESVRRGDVQYASRVVRVAVGADEIAIERVRERSAPGAGGERETDVVRLARVSAGQVGEEGVRAGLRSLPPRVVPATREYVGATVVMLGA